MSVPQFLTLILGGGAISALLTLAWNWHKPRVDRQVTTVDGLNSLIDQLQEERDRANERSEREATRADGCEERARTAEGKTDELLRENGALAHELEAMEAYLKATLQGVAAGTIPPWLTAPYVLHARFPPESMPDWALSPRHDTGTPGVEPPDNT